jgi:hypothetical protein
MTLGGAQDMAGGALRAWSEAQPGEQMCRRFVTEFRVVLHVQVVVLIALPGVHGGGKSRDQFGRWHAPASLQSVDGRPKTPKKPQKSTFSVLWGLAGLRFVDNLGPSALSWGVRETLANEKT